MTKENDQPGQSRERPASKEQTIEQPDTGDTALYDIIIPPGVPRKTISELLTKYDVELVVRKERLYFANMTGDERELLAFRGRHDVIIAVEKDMLRMLDEYIGS